MSQTPSQPTTTRYPDETKRQALSMWASGKYASDAEIASKLGIESKRARHLVAEWRKASEPDGVIELAIWLPPITRSAGGE